MIISNSEQLDVDHSTDSKQQYRKLHSLIEHTDEYVCVS